MKYKCRIYDKNNLTWIDYEYPIWDKIGGVYGYIFVSLKNVLFCYISDNSQFIDDITINYVVEYYEE